MLKRIVKKSLPAFLGVAIIAEGATCVPPKCPVHNETGTIEWTPPPPTASQLSSSARPIAAISAVSGNLWQTLLLIGLMLAAAAAVINFISQH
jgi:hypothetical protein